MTSESFQGRLASLVKSHCSVRKFAQYTELSQTVMVKYINGESTPNLTRLLSIAKALNVRLGWLASGIGTKEAERDYFDRVRLDQFPDRLNKVAGAKPRHFSSTSNLSITGITKYLKGESTPNVERLISIAEAGGVSIEWLATGIEEACGNVSNRSAQELLRLVSEKVQFINDASNNPVFAVLPISEYEQIKHLLDLK